MLGWRKANFRMSGRWQGETDMVLAELKCIYCCPNQNSQDPKGMFTYDVSQNRVRTNFLPNFGLQTIRGFISEKKSNEAIFEDNFNLQTRWLAPVPAVVFSE